MFSALLTKSALVPETTLNLFRAALVLVLVFACLRPVLCSRGLRFPSVRVLVRARIDGQHTNREDLTLCSPCSDVLVPVPPPHVCHRQETGLCLLTPTRQQHVGISLAVARLGAPFRLHDTVRAIRSVNPSSKHGSNLFRALSSYRNGQPELSH